MSGRRDRSWERGGDRDRDRDRGGSGRGGRYPPRGHDSYSSRRGSRSRSPRRDGRDRDRYRDKDRSDRDRRDYRDRGDYKRDRSPGKRDDQRRRDERDGDRERDRERERVPEHGRDSAPPPVASSSNARRTDTPTSGTLGPSVGTPHDREQSGTPEDGEEMTDIQNDDDDAVMAMMGMSGFGSTKGKHVLGNQEGGADVKKVRTWRQYMNRRGGFNRPLDKIK